uniref:Wsv323 n=1 Tax=White spot syndrome virus TaxID=92652 RepID=A0A2U9GHM7_WSSV|nr:wsv323 [Shrimp white spot syndrome virus]AWQ62992.1 wsv323 [Shrimp white spot syndrome virus]AWQ63423.1 wsv323 [Shrimp white spot syndrome virus]
MLYLKRLISSSYCMCFTKSHTVLEVQLEGTNKKIEENEEVDDDVEEEEEAGDFRSISSLTVVSDNNSLEAWISFTGLERLFFILLLL